jgi:DNA recombination protein RmuC
MEYSAIIIVLLSIIVFFMIILIILNRLKSGKNLNPEKVESLILSIKSDLVSQQMEGLVNLRKSLDSATQLLNERLAQGTGAIDKRMEIVGEIENKLGQLATQTKNIELIGNNIQSLSELLRPPKLRGNLGEILLENLLKEILPPALVKTQYQFKDGQRVDAIVHLADRLLPIDSKFPLDSFERIISNDNSEEGIDVAKKEFNTSIKKHIDSISSKYIQPAERTTEFALMYIPSEAVYGYLISNELAHGFDYDLSKRVIPSSPGHLYGFLASLVAVYIESGISRDNQKLLESIRNVQSSLEKIDSLNDRIGGSLRSALGNSEKTTSEINRIEIELNKIQQPEIE